MRTDVSTNHKFQGEPESHADRLKGENPWWLLVKQFPFPLALCLWPLMIQLHECGHYVVHYFQGHQPVLQAGSVTVRHWPPGSSALLSRAGGPTVDLVLCVSGFLWLKSRRRGRLDAPPTALDWLATVMASCCGRWVHHTPLYLWQLYRTGHAGSGDEPTISTLLGFPAWVVPVALLFPACYLFVATIRQHPQSHRLIPFTSLILGASMGAYLWLWMIGPPLLGPTPHPSRAREGHAIRPRVVSSVPAHGAINVEPNLTEIRVTFDRPMSDISWSFCGAGPHFPQLVGEPHYNRSRTNWTAPVKLKPDWTYTFWLNYDDYKGFVSDEGAPLAPVFVSFRTWDLDHFPKGYCEQPPNPSFSLPPGLAGTSVFGGRGTLSVP